MTLIGRRDNGINEDERRHDVAEASCDQRKHRSSTRVTNDDWVLQIVCCAGCQVGEVMPAWSRCGDKPC